MKSGIAFFVCLALLCTPVYAAKDARVSYDIVYDGGSVQGVKAGADLKLFVQPAAFSLEQSKKEVVSVTAGSITEISYGQDVHRRVGSAIAVGVFTLGVGALLALSKSKKHFIGVTWADGANKGGLAIQCSKNEYRGVLAALEGISGKKAVDSITMGVKN